MKKKKVVSMLLVAAMAASLAAGCGGQGGNTDGGSSESEAGGEESEGSQSSDGEPVTLTVLAGQSTTDAGIEDMIDEALAEKYPNITLEWECVDWGNDFQPKMQQYLQSGLQCHLVNNANINPCVH